MEEEIISCPICLEPYDTKEHEPRNIVCGHSVCLHCVSKILRPSTLEFKCPICNRRFAKQNKYFELEDFPKCFVALEIIQARSKGNSCVKHRSVKDLICLDCKTEICLRCLIDGH